MAKVLGLSKPGSRLPRGAGLALVRERIAFTGDRMLHAPERIAFAAARMRQPRERIAFALYRMRQARERVAFNAG